MAMEANSRGFYISEDKDLITAGLRK